MKAIYITHEVYERLTDEHKFLKTVRRKELSKAVGEARDHGDISENAEYDAAKEALAMNEKKIIELEDKLSRVKILDYKDLPQDRALIGATVELEDLDSKEKERYTLVSEVEIDYAQGKISVNSPVGQSLLGHKENQTVKIKTPAGILRYKILKISR
ncbi:MAG: transcription elongation factor GreA [bacterium]